MRPDDFDLRTGVASVYWGLEVANDPVDPERDCLHEDLIQIAFHNGVVVDVGWYQGLPPAGSFRTYIVVDGDWDAPVHVADCTTLADLESVFAYCLARARRFGR